MPKSYPGAFRHQVIDLIESSLSVSELSSRLDFSVLRVYRWWRRGQVGWGVIDDSHAILDDRSREASRRIRDPEEEVKILRKEAEAVDEMV